MWIPSSINGTSICLHDVMTIVINPYVTNTSSRRGLATGLIQPKQADFSRINPPAHPNIFAPFLQFNFCRHQQLSHCTARHAHPVRGGAKGLQRSERGLHRSYRGLQRSEWDYISHKGDYRGRNGGYRGQKRDYRSEMGLQVTKRITDQKGITGQWDYIDHKGDYRS